MSQSGVSSGGLCLVGVFYGIWLGVLSLGIIQGSSGLGSAFPSSFSLYRFAVRVEGSCTGCAVFIDGLGNGYELHE